MSTSTFFVLLPITLIILVLMRVFWLELLSIVIGFKILFYLAILSFGSAIVWSIGINNDQEGFWTCWLFFGIVYLVATALVFGILRNIFDMGVDLIRYIFKL